MPSRASKHHLWGGLLLSASRAMDLDESTPDFWVAPRGPLTGVEYEY